MKIVLRIQHGLELLKKLESLTSVSNVLENLPKENKDNLGKLSLEQYLFEGIKNADVCFLLEAYFSQFEPSSLDIQF